jgi:hypothetical protein
VRAGGAIVTGSRIAALVVAFCLSSGAWAQAPIIYPAKGQTPDQQAADEGQCHAWAKQQTGIDPAMLAAAPPPTAPPAYGGGQRVRGAARGAAGGAAIGAIAGDAGKGAAAGAIAGTMAGGRRARMAQAEGVQYAEAQRQQQLNTYYRALSACMVGRGYTVQ